MLIYRLILFEEITCGVQGYQWLQHKFIAMEDQLQ